MLNSWELEAYTEHVRATGLSELIETIAEEQELGSEWSVQGSEEEPAKEIEKE